MILSSVDEDQNEHVVISGTCCPTLLCLHFHFHLNRQLHLFHEHIQVTTDRLISIVQLQNKRSTIFKVNTTITTKIASSSMAVNRLLTLRIHLNVIQQVCKLD